MEKNNNYKKSDNFIDLKNPHSLQVKYSNKNILRKLIQILTIPII